MKKEIIKIAIDLAQGYITESQARTNLLSLFGVSESSFTAKIDKPTAFGVPHHNHSEHRVYIDKLTFKQAKKIKYFLNEIVFKNYFR